MQSSLKFPSARVLPRQGGAVLIMVLLIVALVAGLGIKFAGDYQLGLARAEARWHGLQARAYLFSGEGTALRYIAQDDPSFDAYDDPWGGEGAETTFELDGGQLSIRLLDASAQFNLNSLGPVNNEMVGPKRYNGPQRFFIRLLQTLTVSDEDKTPLVASATEASAILEAIVDWADNDNQPLAAGAESDYYLSQPDPYQAANMPFRSVEELRMVKGITPEIMRALRRYVTVISPAEQININTMDDRFYRCINVAETLEPLDENAAETLRSGKPSAGHYTNMAEFDTTLSKVFGTGSAVDKDMFSVKTNFFWLRTIAIIGDQRRGGRSLIQRGNPQPTVVRREELNIYDQDTPQEH